MVVHMAKSVGIALGSCTSTSPSGVDTVRVLPSRHPISPSKVALSPLTVPEMWKV